jgi:3'(2'), 5'-bisphosphate nucleotidase
MSGGILTDTLVDALLQVAHEAGELIDEVYASGFDIELKGPNDPVTTADRRANEHICARLEALFPGVPVVAEESEVERFAGFAAAPQVFFVDPLDGTREFVRRNPEFVVMLGLLDGDRASVGVLLSPTTGAAWLGEVGRGAFHVTAEGVRSPLGVSGVKDLAEARIVASRAAPEAVNERLKRVLGVPELLPLGSAGLKGIRVAEGRADAYVAPRYAGKRWDACAIDALVVAAGGRFSDARGDLINYRRANLTNDRGLLGTNAFLHEALVERLREVARSTPPPRAS